MRWASRPRRIPAPWWPRRSWCWRASSPRSASHAAKSSATPACGESRRGRDRKSTRLNSSHGYISYAVFCLKKKKKKQKNKQTEKNKQIIKKINQSSKGVKCSKRNSKQVGTP